MGSYTSAVYETEAGELAGAWPRFWARLFDIGIYSLPSGFLIGLAFPSLFASSDNSYQNNVVVGLTLLPLTMIFDAIVIALTGSSPGKAIAGLSVGDLDGQRITIEKSLLRNLRVYLGGMILGIPLLCLFGYVSAHNAIKEHGVTSWDEATETRVYGESNNLARTVLIAILAVVIVSVGNAMAKI